MAIPVAPAPIPAEIKLHQASRLLELAYADGTRFQLPCEFLRVYSPSAEVRGHGPGQEVLQIGKREVQIAAIEPVGTYAIKLTFSDGHDTGLFSWTIYLRSTQPRSALATLSESGCVKLGPPATLRAQFGRQPLASPPPGKNSEKLHE